MPNKKHHENLKKDFHMAYEEHADALFRYSFYKLSDREKAKDVVQDTYVRYWEYVATDGRDKIDNVKAFLFRIATNAITDHYRKKKDISLDSLSDEGFDPADTDTQHRLVRSVDSQTALSLVYKLEPRTRDIVLMKYVDGLSVKEIAEILEERENTISVKLHRAHKDLQDLFEHTNDK